MRQFVVRASGNCSLPAFPAAQCSPKRFRGESLEHRDAVGAVPMERNFRRQMKRKETRYFGDQLAFQTLEPRYLLAAVVNVQPAQQTHVASGQPGISATFDAELLTDSVSPQSFVVRGMQTGLRQQMPTVASQQITLSPETPFRAGELVEVTATRAIKSFEGEPLENPFVWQFRAVTSGGRGDFTKPRGRSLGDLNTLDVAVGDVDGDGDLDAVEVNSSYGANTLWINDGAGHFTNSGKHLGSGGNAVALGDLDGDGDLDGVVAGAVGVKFVVWRNDGLGNFTDDGQASGDFLRSQDVALGDFDSDGDLDIFLLNGGGQERTDNGVWINDGSANFSDSGQMLGDSDSRSVVLGDLDGDGDLDAFVANGWFGDVADKIWLNDEGGTFRESEQSLSSTPSRGVALGDVDGDGDLDALIQSFEQPNTLWLNDGNGGFRDSEQVLGINTNRDDETFEPIGETAAVALRDVDGDGDLDARIGKSVWRNDGLGTFTDTIQHLDGRALALGDLDGDGDLDEFAGRIGSNKVRLNDGTGLFSEDGRTLGSGERSRFRGGYEFGDIEIGDMDGDGDLDAFVADIGFCDDTGCNDGGSNRIWINDGNGRFHDSGQRLGDNLSADVALGDLDGDGDLDAIVANGRFSTLRTQHNTVWLNDGQGRFLASQHTLGAGSTAVKLGDIDGDGDLDAVLEQGAQNRSAVWMNDGSAMFTRSQSLGDASIHHLGDYDGDGDLDGFFENTIWLNDSHGNFTNSRQRLGSQLRGVDFGDLDGDGDLDAYIARQGGERGYAPNAIWWNDGTGRFSDSGQELGNARSNAVKIGDIDGDGDLDAFVANSYGYDDAIFSPKRWGENKVWLNDGTGNFRESGQDSHLLGTSTSNGLLAMGDLDADGDLDVIVDNGPDLKVLINQDLLPGDANRDGIFNSADLIAVFQAGKFEDDVPNNSLFDEGDWNGDGEFDSSDFVFAFQQGNYSAAARNALGSSSGNATIESLFGNDKWASLKKSSEQLSRSQFNLVDLLFVT